ncbi:1,4-dihydroxy-2-naphthoate octaprenyltransferase [Candidatus Shikimatogenerans silvanidophilus]|uniref:1,4-dihydroxy-2-naphthoate octaprenyltransferase n=1 Tax=Candidatus Shikimatogenerans silvanidophilus TaxID=2782547 RepID=UPI001BAA1E36|nr:1,4-dihydroxy-2-naphthoate octaprenyltransferase [Candidatus Shikimatogenerans silvanidophilus]
MKNIIIKKVNNIKNIIIKKIFLITKIIRLHTLLLSLSGVFLGTLLSLSLGFFNIKIFFWLCITSLSIQILANISNDYGDFKNLIDQYREDKRELLNNKFYRKNIKLIIYFLSIFFFISGFIVYYLSFYNLYYYNKFICILLFFCFILLIFISLYSAIRYTIGKNPYGYLGLGDLFVFIFFGIISVNASFFVYTYYLLSKDMLLLSSSLGLLNISVLNLNNLRDLKIDKEKKKNTIPVIIGIKKAKIYHSFLLIFPFFLTIIYFIINYKGILQFLFIFLIIPIFLHIKNINKKNVNYNYELKKIILITFLYSILVGIVDFFYLI